MHIYIYMLIYIYIYAHIYTHIYIRIYIYIQEKGLNTFDHVIFQFFFYNTFSKMSTFLFFSELLVDSFFFS